MKKILMFLGVAVAVLSMGVFAYAASVTPEVYPGDDSNPSQYTPPPDFIHYEIPESALPGYHTVRLNSAGAVDPDGKFVFTAQIGVVLTESGEAYTKLFSWSSNFPVYAVVIQGGDSFNLYTYNSNIRSDTDLIAPYNTSGQPVNIEHVSIVYNPSEFPAAATTIFSGSGVYGLLALMIFVVFLIIIFLSLLFIIALLVLLTKSCKSKRKEHGIPCSPYEPEKPCRPECPDEPDEPDEPCDPNPGCPPCNPGGLCNPRRLCGPRRNPNNSSQDNNRR